jgi:proteasome assembly chaperone (PAC2) family protein
MNALSIERIPELNDPVLIVAFAGWNDAGSAATHATQFLIKRLQAQRFATIDPEEFYNFSEVRPHVRLRDGLYREIRWPANEFFASNAASLKRDMVLGLGIEPNLRWKAYSAACLDVAKQCGVGLVITLGALLADVAYSKPVRVVGFSSDPDIATQLQLTPSRYEGPTGIVGVLNDACRQAGLTSISFWANVPHYISAAPNPKAALALVSRLESFLHIALDTTELVTGAAEFDAQVTKAIAENPNLAAYVKRLEEQEQEEGLETETAEQGKTGNGNGHANGKDMAEELQRFLQQRKDRKDDD